AVGGDGGDAGHEYGETVDDQIVGLGEVAPGPIRRARQHERRQQRRQREGQMYEFIGSHGVLLFWSSGGFGLAGQEGFEPPSRGFGDRCSTIRATALKGPAFGVIPLLGWLYLVSL